MCDYNVDIETQFVLNLVFEINQYKFLETLVVLSLEALYTDFPVFQHKFLAINMFLNLYI